MGGSRGIVSIARKPSPELLELLEPHDERLVARALEARAAVLRQARQSWELIYKTYAVSVTFCLTAQLKHGFCHIAVYRKHVNLGFNRGTELPDPQGLLQGTGKLIRHVRLEDGTDLGKGPVVELIRAAHEQMLERMAERGESPTHGAVLRK